MISQDDLRNILRHRCEAAGGQKAWAEANDISQQYVSDILGKRRQVSRSIAAKLGYNKRAVFFPCIPGATGA